jgi:hypothetical protein
MKLEDQSQRTSESLLGDLMIDVEGKGEEFCAMISLIEDEVVVPVLAEERLQDEIGHEALEEVKDTIVYEGIVESIWDSKSLLQIESELYEEMLSARELEEAVVELVAMEMFLWETGVAEVEEELFVKNLMEYMQETCESAIKETKALYMTIENEIQ